MFEKESLLRSVEDALGNTLPGRQMCFVKATTKALLDLMKERRYIRLLYAVSHRLAWSAMHYHSLRESAKPPLSLSTYIPWVRHIGYDLQGILWREELPNQEICPHAHLSSILSLRFDVDPIVTALKISSKKPSAKFVKRGSRPSGQGMDAFSRKEDAGRGYRRVVASQNLFEIVERSINNYLVNTNKIDYLLQVATGDSRWCNGHHLKDCINPIIVWRIIPSLLWGYGWICLSFLQQWKVAYKLRGKRKNGWMTSL